MRLMDALSIERFRFISFDYPDKLSAALLPLD